MTEEIENSKTKYFSRRRALCVLLVSITVSVIPLIIVKMLYNEQGISRNALLSELVLPAKYYLVILLTVLLVALTDSLGILNLKWFRISRSEIIGTILLILVVPTVYCVIGLLMHKLGLNLRWNHLFLVDQQGLAFFVTLTILIAVVGPILEEIFWRGYVQATLERMIGGLPAFLGQAVLFGVIHLRPWGGFVPLLVMGLITGAWRWKRRTLVPVILAHIAINSLWCAVRWPDWLDCTRIKITNDYLAEYKIFVGVDKLDTNDNARDFYEKARQTVVKVPPEWSQVEDIWPAHWLPEQKEAISAWLLENEQSEQYVSQGSQKPFYWPEFKGNILMTAMPDIAWVRHAVFSLYAHSQIDAADGNLDKSFSELITCLRFADHFAGQKPVICQLVSFNMRANVTKAVRMILSNVAVPPAKLEHLQKSIEQSLADGTYFFDFTVEKFLLHDFIQRLFTVDGSGSGHIPEIALRTPESFLLFLSEFSEQKKQALLRLDRHDTTSSTDLFFSRLALVAKMTAWRFQIDSNLIKKQLELITRRNAFISVFGSSYNKLLDRSSRARTDAEAMIAILAIFRYKAEKGQLPSSLETLVDQHYLKTLPQDSYSFKPHIYKQTESGFLLYSLGADFDDDGGTPSKWGEGDMGGDQVFWPVEGTNEYIELQSKVQQ